MVTQLFQSFSALEKKYYFQGITLNGTNALLCPGSSPDMSTKKLREVDKIKFKNQGLKKT